MRHPGATHHCTLACAASTCECAALPLAKSVLVRTSSHLPPVLPPAGAGKTNVAMLCVLHEIGLHRDAASGEIDTGAFKIVYVAPMKALVAEMVGNFRQRLKPYDIRVEELTGGPEGARAGAAWWPACLHAHCPCPAQCMLAARRLMPCCPCAAARVHCSWLLAAGGSLSAADNLLLLPPSSQVTST